MESGENLHKNYAAEVSDSNGTKLKGAFLVLQYEPLYTPFDSNSLEALSHR